MLFSHKQAGVDVGNASVAWAKKNNVTQPVVALIGNLSDAQGKKRTDYALRAVKKGTPPVPEQAIQEAKLTSDALKADGGA